MQLGKRISDNCPVELSSVITWFTLLVFYFTFCCHRSNFLFSDESHGMRDKQ